MNRDNYVLCLGVIGAIAFLVAGWLSLGTLVQMGIL